ncbi:MAG: histidine phosphatase family protein [Polyangiaceae bacterium]|nr:histidine phosphatase family protein [Polyangiaceae bacterium]
MPTFSRSEPKLALVMVGLPARGKSYIARKLARYLRWRGMETRVCNVGMYRRELVGAQVSHSFFDPANPDGLAERMRVAQIALDDMLRWLELGGQIGILDATNSTRERRAWISKTCAERGAKVVFIETMCQDPGVIDRNVRETKLHSPDYVGVEADAAVRDFIARIAHYERAYQSVEDDEGPYVKVIDEGDKVIVHQIEGNILSHVVFFLMNLRTKRRPLWLVRHGESIFNVEDRIGGDSELSPRGHAFARSLAAFMQTRRTEEPISVWTSQLKRTLQTAQYLREEPFPNRALDEIDAGVCDGLTYAEVRRRHPEEFAARSKDKLNYRYPRGESYADVIQRLDPVIIEIERHERPILIVGHQGVLRALYAYLMDTPPRESPHLPMPLHTVLELTPNAYGCTERRFPLAC